MRGDGRRATATGRGGRGVGRKEEGGEVGGQRPRVWPGRLTQAGIWEEMKRGEGSLRGLGYVPGGESPILLL